MSDAAEVEAVNTEFYAAFETGDLDRMGAVWDEGEVACVHPGWPRISGRPRVLRSWAVIMANTTYIQFVLTDVAIDVHQDVAVLTCDENILTNAEPGDASRVTTTNVYQRRGDRWRLVVHHASPVLAPDRPVPEEL